MLKRFTLVALLLCFPLIASGDDAKAAADDAAIAQFQGDANSADDLRKYAGEVFGQVAQLLQSDKADEAAAKIDALEKFATDLEVTDKGAKEVQGRITDAVTFFRKRIDLARVSIDDLKKKLEDEPTSTAVEQYLGKLAQQLAPMASSDPEKAEEQMTAAKTFLDGIAENSEDDAVKKAISQSGRMFGQLEKMIESELKLAKLIGADAPPLGVKDWANGDALTDDDLKGKVVLLDFWAVWCGPCIATFPHLIEWNEEYGDKGLVIIGLTRYYNMKWDDETGRAARSTDEVSHEDEQVMLKKFAEEHKLTHRFGIQDDRTLSEFYGVTGIPHVVLIDREGKIRLMKVGAGPGNAEEIGSMIKELVEG